VPIGEGHGEGRDVDYETIPTGSQRARRPTPTITTTATISTSDGEPLPRHYPDTTPMPKAGGEADAYVYTARQLSVGGSRGGGYDLEAGKKLAVGDSSSLPRQPAAAGEGESYELRHVHSNGSVV
jgi:hypothetical protein